MSKYSCNVLFFFKRIQMQPNLSGNVAYLILLPNIWIYFITILLMFSITWQGFLKFKWNSSSGFQRTKNTQVHNSLSSFTFLWFYINVRRLTWDFELAVTCNETSTMRASNWYWLSIWIYRNYYKASDYELSKGCDKVCRTDLLCGIVTTNYMDQSRCQKIKQRFSSMFDFV